MTAFDWLASLSPFETIAGMTGLLVLVGYLVSRFGAISLPGVKLGNSNGSILTEIIRREMELHETGMALARNHAIDHEIRLVRDQMSMAEQLISEALSTLRVAFLEYIRGLGVRGNPVADPTYRDFLRLERDIRNELLADVRQSMRENGLPEMSGEQWAQYKRRRADALIIRVAMTRDQYWLGDVVSADDLHNMLIVSRDDLVEIFFRMFHEAREIALRYQERHNTEREQYARDRQEFYNWMQEQLKKCS